MAIRPTSSTSGPQGQATATESSGVIGAVVIGIVIGALGRLVPPGRQRISVLWTIGIGIVAALVGTGIAADLGVAGTEGFDWIEWLIQIGLAAAGVTALERAKAHS
ncbi:GlsB/YeaQ/YmgE family stress response membrane protein [Streptomyces decoyicus]|uniref:GlsB/YeaQ/YmgE family stress response membrane protein n=1 Tax=Streptomyces decoyicus TaxID=249567 RepID=A0ABZ1FDC0_9ACTN|nr:GlsB/YeaQ/YmgE family stress response membrane protein [Streptomyces decoyicus]WSB68371.1 GlsB/YeaQ/YmgE family stress response membrane protein [Streptomyces decoyicus]